MANNCEVLSYLSLGGTLEQASRGDKEAEGAEEKNQFLYPVAPHPAPYTLQPTPYTWHEACGESRQPTLIK
jgi:hypothetical protein